MIEFETSAGEVLRLVLGMVVLAEDTIGKGHKARSVAKEDAVLGIAQMVSSAL